MKNIIAIIPARGGSKRLPGKNIKPLMGKTLLGYSIEYALNTQADEKTIVVSTDNIDIKKIALQYKVQVIDRPKELSGDLVPTLDVLKHAVSQFPNHKWVVLLQPTNPLRPKNLLKDAFEILNKEKYDSLMTVTENRQKFGKIINGKFQPFNYTLGQRSQDMEPLYFENGLLYISKPEIILQGQLLGENPYPMIVNHPYAKVDIDTLEDFEYAEFILNNYKNE